jgi:hypothetical protein
VSSRSRSIRNSRVRTSRSSQQRRDRRPSIPASPANLLGYPRATRNVDMNDRLTSGRSIPCQTALVAHTTRKAPTRSGPAHRCARHREGRHGTGRFHAGARNVAAAASAFSWSPRTPASDTDRRVRGAVAAFQDHPQRDGRVALIFGRSNPATTTRGRDRPRRSTMSSRTSGVAVAVKAAMGGRPGWRSLRQHSAAASFRRR